MISGVFSSNSCLPLHVGKSPGWSGFFPSVRARNRPLKPRMLIFLTWEWMRTMVQCRLFSLHYAFSIVSENAIKSTEVSLLYKYAILRSHETGGLMTKSKGIIFLVGNHVTMWLKITKKRIKMRNFLFQIVSKSVRFPNDIMLRKTTFC